MSPLSSPSPPPQWLSGPGVEAPDADFETVRERAMEELRSVAKGWTDHNVHDPGVTLLEAAAWVLADLHYRTSEAAFAGTSARVPGSVASLLPEEAPAVEAAARLWGEHAAEVRRLVDEAGGREAAAETLGDLAHGEGLGPLDDEVIDVLVRAVRGPRRRRVELERREEIDEALEETGDPASAAARAEQVLDDEGLWREELDELLHRARRRHLSSLMRSHGEMLVEVVLREADGPGELADALREEDLLPPGLGDLTDAETDRLLGLRSAPPLTPEWWEDADGRSRTWPPHPLQVRSVEPVTAADYRRLALSMNELDRVWVVPGVGRGLRWDGRRQETELPELPGAVTLVVETSEILEEGGRGSRERWPSLPREPWSSLKSPQADFLRRVLRQVLGGEGGAPDVDDPLPDLRQTPSGQAPRRLLGDEVGAALLSLREVVVRARLDVFPSTPEGPVTAEAMRRLEDYLSPDRLDPDRSPPTYTYRRVDELDGPWPRLADAWRLGGARPVPPPGWPPGEPVRVSDLVRVLAGVPGVEGVEGLEVRYANRPGEWTHEELRPGPFTAPIYTHRPECLQTRVVTPEACRV